MSYLPGGAGVVFVASGVEDPERTPAVEPGLRGSRNISVEAGTRGK